MARVTRAAAVLIVAAVSCVAAASAAAASSLEGEQFINSDTFDLTSFECSESGGTVTFTAAGDAAGPYPGTYEATVTLQSGPLTESGGYLYGSVASFEETYTITSGPTTITGTKSGASGGDFYCRTYQSAECTAIEAWAAGDAAYTATIDGRPDYGTATYNVDVGSGETAFDCGGELAVFGANFTQHFVDSLAPDEPATAADCKNSRWQQYGTFRNQGECVSFVKRAQHTA